MATRVDRWSEVAELFTERLAAVGAAEWGAPTPCEDWDVRALVEHAVAYQWGYLSALGRADGVDPALGDDPPRAWATVRSALTAAYSDPDTLGGTFDFLDPLVPGSVADQVIVPTTDLLLHTWDLSRAVGADESLPEAICDEILAVIEPLDEMIRIPEWYGPALDSPADAGPQTRLLRFAGRPG